MIRRIVAGGGLSLLLILGLWPRVTAQEAPPSTPPQTSVPAAEPQTAEPPAQEMPAAAEQAPEQAEVMACGECHDQAKAFAHNPHARGEVKDGVVPNAVCETCHGDGAAHIEAGGDPTKIAVPRGLTGANETCMMCHDTATDRKSHRTGMHANSNAVNCLSCHAVHSSEPRLLARNEVTVCSTCHTAQAASFRNKPYTHRLGRGGMSCSSCHEPHGRPGKESVRKTRAGELACFSCHTDKRGPYVFPHGGTQVSNDCSNCHEPHGSANPNQLRRTRMAQQCLECHSPITHDTLGSQPPSFHNLNNPRYQNCTTCHVAVHGSNRSPQLLK
jgi:DmsE family decaheme c-type cytochrome